MTYSDLTLFPLVKSAAYFSPDRIHRYALWRTWDESKPKALFIGLNPSTADEVKDDPTIRRCMRYCRDWGYGGYIMGNIFAFRATDPKVMRASQDPIGPENNEWLLKLHHGAEITIGAWGNHGEFMNRGAEIVDLIPQLHCLKITGQGYPSHPLYLPKSLKPIPFKK